MALTKLTTDVSFISKLDNDPSDDAGMTPSTLKAKFDAGSNAIKTYINDTLLPETEAGCVSGIERTSGSGAAGGTDTYTITFMDGHTSTFTLYNGTDGAKGDTGEKGETGEIGAAGKGVASLELVSGSHAAGASDTYRITFTDSSTFDFTVYNGADGNGTGDMTASTYDPNGKAGDAFNMDNMSSGTENKVFTAAEQEKLSGIAAGAEVNVNPDWNAGSGKARILNRPESFPPSSHTHDDRYYTESEADTLLSQKAGKAKTAALTLTAAGWSGGAQSVNAAGVTASSVVLVSPTPDYQTAYCDAGIKCTAQGAGTLTFTCEMAPGAAVAVNAVIMEAQA